MLGRVVNRVRDANVIVVDQAIASCAGLETMNGIVLQVDYFDALQRRLSYIETSGRLARHMPEWLLFDGWLLFR